MGSTEGVKPILKMLPVSWEETVLISGSRSLQRDTVGLYRLQVCKVTSCQRWRFEKNSAAGQSRTTHLQPRFESWTIGSSSNFDGPFNLQRLTVTLWKYFDPIVNIFSSQETGRIVKIGYYLLKWPHLYNHLLSELHSSTCLKTP